MKDGGYLCTNHSPHWTTPTSPAQIGSHASFVGKICHSTLNGAGALLLFVDTVGMHLLGIADFVAHTMIMAETPYGWKQASTEYFSFIYTA